MIWLLVEWGGYRMKKKAVRRENNFIPVKVLTELLKSELNCDLACEQDDLFLYRIQYDSTYNNRIGNTLASVLEFFESNRRIRFDYSLLLYEEEGVSPHSVLEKLKERLFPLQVRKTLFIDKNVSFPYTEFFNGHFSKNLYIVEKGESGSWLLHGTLDGDFRNFNRELDSFFNEWEQNTTVCAIEVYGCFSFILKNWILEHWKESYDIKMTPPETPLKKGRRKTIHLIPAANDEEAENALQYLKEISLDRHREVIVIIRSGTKPLWDSEEVWSLYAVFTEVSCWEREMIRLFGVIVSVKDFLEISQIPKLLKEMDEFPMEKSEFCVKNALLFGFWNLEGEDKVEFKRFASILHKEIHAKKEEFFAHLNDIVFKMFNDGEIYYPESYVSYLLNQSNDSERYYKVLTVIQTLLQQIKLTDGEMVLEILADYGGSLSDGNERILIEQMVLLSHFYRAQALADSSSLQVYGEKIVKLTESSGNLKIDFEKKVAVAVYYCLFCRMEEAVNVAKDLLFRVNEISDESKNHYRAMGHYLIAVSMFGMQKLYEGACYLDFLFKGEADGEKYSTIFIQAQLLRASSLFVSGQFMDLEAFFKEPHELYTEGVFQNRFFYRFLQSRFYFEIGRYQKAEEILLDLIRDCAHQRISNLEDTVSILQAWVARIYIYSGHPLKAKRCFEALPRPSADGYFFQAEGALWEGKIDEAFQFLSRARKLLKPSSTLSVNLLTTKKLQSGFEEVEDHFFFYNSRRTYLLHYVDFLDNLLRVKKKEEGALLKLSKFIRVQFIQKPDPSFHFFLYTNTMVLQFLAEEHADEFNADTISTKIQLMFFEKKFFVPDHTVCQEFLKNNFWTQFLEIDGNKFK